MRTSAAFFALSALFSPLYALTILSPFPGSTIDPTQPITVSWLSSGSDPSRIDLKIVSSEPSSLSTNQVLASGLSTSSGTFTIPANTIQNYGTGYQIEALGSGGSVIATAGNLALGAGSANVQTASNGQVSFVSTATAAAPATSGKTTAPTAAGATVTSSFDSAAATGGATILSGTVTAGATASSSTKSSGFLTSSTSRSGTSTSATSAAATSAANTNTANSLGKMRSGGEIVMGAAGVLAGVLALIV